MGNMEGFNIEYADLADSEPVHYSPMVFELLLQTNHLASTNIT